MTRTSSPAAPTMPNCRLLILDDDPMIGLTIQLIAESSGAAARLCTEPDEFFTALETWEPSHICTDLNMPAMDGLAVLAELGRRGCQAQVIVSSGVGQRVIDAAARAGAAHGLAVVGVLAKPFVPASLRQLLATRADPAPALPAAPVATPTFQPVAEDLVQALARGELSVVYQPKVHCISGALAGFEVLARWQHPVHGAVGPDRFIPLAEKADLVDRLTIQVLDRALAWFIPWRREGAGREALTLSINLSARTLGQPEVVTQLQQRCQDTGMPADRLIFELTETAAMDNPTLALELLTRLRMQGFQLSIDDFGTGYSSMVQLVRLPFSEVKVDRSFVMSAATSEESRVVIRSVVGLGHNLGLRVTAEGVEDEATLDYLRQVGCDEAQGYLIARPMAERALQAWLLARAPGPGAADGGR